MEPGGELPARLFPCAGVPGSIVPFCGQSRPLPPLIAGREHCMIKTDERLFRQKVRLMILFICCLVLGFFWHLLIKGNTY